METINTRGFLNPIFFPYPKSKYLPHHLNPFVDEGVDIMPIMIFNPTFPNMKVAVALNMLEEAEEAGQLKGINTLVEATS